MKTNNELQLNKYVLMNAGTSILILAIIVLGFGEACVIKNGGATFSITFFQYAFKTNLTYTLNAALSYYPIYITLFILLLIAISFSITNTILNLLHKKIYKLEFAFIISLIAILALAFITIILSKTIFINDLKDLWIMSPSQFEKLWQNSKLGAGAICIATFCLLALVPVSFNLYYLNKEKRIG